MFFYKFQICQPSGLNFDNFCTLEVKTSGIKCALIS